MQQDLPLLIEPNLIPLLGDALLPDSVRNAVTLQHISSPRMRMHLKSKGAWAIKEAKSDPDAWIVVYWPYFTRAFLTNRSIGPKLEELGYADYRDLRPTSDPHMFRAQWKLFQRYFETELLPPGACLQGSTNYFNDLYSFLPPEATHEGLTIFRAGSMLSSRYKTAQQRYTSLSIANQAAALPNELISKLPIPIQLLLAALKGASRGSRDPYTEWGLAWTSKGLIFHMARAAEALRANSDVYPLLSIPSVDQFLDAWMNDHNYSRQLPGAKVKLSAILDTSLDTIVKHTDTYDRCLPSEFMFSHVQRFDPVYNLVFPFRFKTDKLDILKYMKTLVTKRLAALEPPQDPSVTKEPLLSSSTKTKSKQKFARSTSRINFNAISFGYGGNEDTGMAINLIKHGDTFISLPDEIVERLPPIGNPKWFSRSYRAMGITPSYVSPTGEKIKVRFQRTPVPEGYATFKYEDRVYFNLALLNPDGGEVFTALSSLCSTHSRATYDTLELIKAFKVFCLWLTKPTSDEVIYDCVDEWRRLVDPNSDSPIKLNTLEERVEFLWNFGIKSSSTPIAWIADKKFMPKENTRRVYTNVDEYVMWYAINNELPQLEYKLNKAQLGEYLAKRWMWWRKTTAVVEKLPAVRSTFMDGNKKPLYDGDMSYLIQKSDEMFGPVMGLS